MADPRDDRSLGELLAELSRETGVLIRKEVELATTEMTAKAKKASADAGMMAAGGALVHAGLLVLLAAIVIVLTNVGIAAWLSALLVALLTMGIGYMLANRGLVSMRSTTVAPTQTIETIKENARWTTGQKA